MPIVLEVVTPPAEEPVTLVEAKAHLRVDGSDEDTLITALIKASRQKAEDITNRAFVTTTFNYFLQDFPRTGHPVTTLEGRLIRGNAGELEFPISPLQSVTHIKYTDELDVVRTVDSATYRLDNKKNPGRVVLRNDQEWPTDFPDLASVNAIEAQFIAGYGLAAAVPEAIKQAVLMIVGHLHENREAVVVRGGVLQAKEIPLGAKYLLDDYRIF